DNPANVLDFGGYLPSGVVSFAAGESVKQVSVAVSGDNVGEADEGFSLLLSNAVNGDIIVSSATATVVNDDVAIAIEALDADKAEGDTGLTEFVFRVARSGSTDGATVVDWQIEGVGDFRADALDFEGGAMPTGSLLFD